MLYFLLTDELVSSGTDIFLVPLLWHGSRCSGFFIWSPSWNSERTSGQIQWLYLVSKSWCYNI